ncbi:MAG TPA: GNAT family protein [Candidatus Acidoferrum sp.]|jgi:RimJ/RimL family protein N-acetyltransferase|nr:GNAT family protein [Candidatus Acidoferrum sp.]
MLGAVKSPPPSKLSWSTAREPARAAIVGELVRLEVLDPERHATSLYTSSHVPGAEDLWQHLPYGPFAGQEEFTAWLEQRAASADPRFYAVVDKESMRALGMASYMRIKPEHGVIEIGHIWFAPELQRTRKATEAIFLLAKTAFDDLGYRRLEWKCDSLNLPSRRAADRFGFTFEGIFRQHMIVKGRNRDTAWFSITDGEWPLRKAAFEAWLSPANFDPSGNQHRGLAEVRASLEVG